MKKLGTSVLALLLAVALFGCAAPGEASSGGNNTAPSSEPASQPSTQAGGEATDNPWWVGDDPITITGLGHMSVLYVDVEGYNSIPGIQIFSETTNLHVEWEHTNNDNLKEQLNLSFASQKMPDIYTHIGKVDAMKYGEQGALIDLMPLIKEHAPNIMVALEQDPTTIPMFTTENGELYCLPQIDDDYRIASYQTLVIQQAWLDKLNLEAPTTSDEFYEVLKAFKDNAAELTSETMLPYSSYFSTNMLGWYDTFSWMFGVYGARAYPKGDTLVYGALEPEFKDVIAYIQKLYNEGLIDPDLDANKDDATFEAKMANNRVGIGFVGQGRIGTYNQLAGAAFDAFNIVPMVPAKAPDGKVYYGATGPLAHSDIALAISINNDHPEETIKAWDWFFSEEGKMVMNFGVEGDTYEYVDGEAAYTDKIMNDPDLNANQTLLRMISPLYNFPCARMWQFERAQLGPVLAEYKLDMIDAGALAGVRAFNLGNLPISADAVSQFAVIQEDLNTYLNESLVKFIRGEWTIEANYDTFANTLRSMGVEDLMEVLNKGYAQVVG